MAICGRESETVLDGSGEDRRVVEIGFGDRLDHVRFARRDAKPFAAGREACRGAVPVGQHQYVDVVAQRRRLHLVDVAPKRGAQVVVAVPVHDDRPRCVGAELARRLATREDCDDDPEQTTTCAHDSTSVSRTHESLCRTLRAPGLTSSRPANDHR